jgi:hypothetical protein
MKKFVSFIALALLNPCTYAQDMNTITTAVPFLLINPNAQSMGIGDIGVVAATDYYESGLTQNPALLSRNEKVMGVKFSYEPWLRQLVSDLKIINGSIYYAFNKKITLGYSYNLFSLGQVVFLNANGTPVGGTIHAKEFYHNLKYAQSLTPNLSVGLGLKYIASDLTNNQPMNGEPTHVGRAIAGDLGVDYRKEIAKKETSFWRYDLGVSVLNMGNKIRYTDTAHGDFLPMQLCLGTMWTYNKDVNSTIRYSLDLAYQCEKLLVPTPPVYAFDNTGRQYIAAGKDPDVSVVKGALQSFNDAPDGMREEFEEILHKVGVENRLTFNKESSAALRLGFLNESRRKGNRSYFDLGVGGKYKFIYLDFAMIVPYRQRSPLNPNYFSGVKPPYSFNVTFGFKYTFKEKVVAKEEEL